MSSNLALATIGPSFVATAPFPATKSASISSSAKLSNARQCHEKASPELVDPGERGAREADRALERGGGGWRDDELGDGGAAAHEECLGENGSGEEGVGLHEVGAGVVWLARMGSAGRTDAQADHIRYGDRGGLGERAVGA